MAETKDIPDLKIANDHPEAQVVFKDTYAFFEKNIMRSVGVFVGVEDWTQDMSILESYAMPVAVCDPLNHAPEWREAVETKRAKLMDWLNYLKAKGMGHYFVNPRMIGVSRKFPGHASGARDVEDPSGNKESVPIATWDSLLAEANELRGKAKAEEPYFALCRIFVPHHEVEVISSLLATHHRPSILYVRWSQNPDDSQLLTETAGHLQTVGYRLLAIRNSYFLYQYTGKDLYSCCSWTEPSMGHPLVTMFAGQATEAVQQALEAVQERLVASQKPAPETSEATTEASATPQ
jgi:hypothetical protein